MDINKFCIAGINYRKAHAVMRGLFAINNEQYTSLLFLARSYGINELFVLSTCNRTEIYSFTNNSDELIGLLCSQTEGDAETFKKYAYIKKGADAIEHIFNVGAGLDSQILGDYEIVGQLKTAAKFSKQYGFMGANLERLVNSVLQCSKSIKNQTQLSGGTVSVSFAAVQYIRTHVKNTRHRKILLLGVGKIGRNTCKNLVDYLSATNITLINRSPEKALKLAGELNLKTAPISGIEDEIRSSDIIITATNATAPIILASHLQNSGNKLIIDLSIPYNVEEAAGNLPNIQMVNIDELSKLKDKTLNKRKAEIPKAKSIIAKSIVEYYDWYAMRKHVPMLKDLKLKLKEIHLNNLREFAPCEETLDMKIQRVLNETAGKIKTDNQKGCQYISAINDFIRTA